MKIVEDSKILIIGEKYMGMYFLSKVETESEFRYFLTEASRNRLEDEPILDLEHLAILDGEDLLYLSEEVPKDVYDFLNLGRFVESFLAFSKFGSRILAMHVELNEALKVLSTSSEVLATEVDQTKHAGA